MWSSRVKGMLRGRFWYFVCVNWRIRCWVMVVQVQLLGFGLLDAQNVLSAMSGCKIIFLFSLTDMLEGHGGRWCVYDRMRHLSILIWATMGSNMKNMKKLDFFKRGLGTCVGKLECFECYFSVIFAWFVIYKACNLLRINTRFVKFGHGIATWIGFAWSMVRGKLGSFWGVMKWKQCQGTWWQVHYFGYVGW